MKYKTKEKKAIDMARGKEAEKEYASIYNENIVEWPTEEEDMREHWDVKIGGIKIGIPKKNMRNFFLVYILFTLNGLTISCCVVM